MTFGHERTSPADAQRGVDEQNSRVRCLAMGTDQKRNAYKLVVSRLLDCGLAVLIDGPNWTDDADRWTHYFRLLIVEADRELRL